MKVQFSLFKRVLLVATLWSANLVKGDLFNFPEESLLSEENQESIRKIFLETMLDASKAFITLFQDPVFYNKIKISLSDPSILKTILSERFFNYSREKEDRNLVNKFVRFTKKEENFSYIMQDGNDGLFNGIIRETIRRFAVKNLDRTKDKKAILKEIFNVLWNGITNKNLICSIDVNFINAIKESIGGELSYTTISSVYDCFHNTPGDFCDKIAMIVANTLYNEFNDKLDESCCCGCLKSTLGIAKKVLKKVIPMVPTLIQVAILIAKELI